MQDDGSGRGVTSELEQDEPLPPNQWAKCGRCRAPFWCEVHRGRPTFVPLFCAACEEAMLPALRAADARAREKARRKGKKVDMGAVADALLGGVKKTLQSATGAR